MGLLNGLILSMLTLRLRYFWLAWLAAILGNALGGALFGLLVFRAGHAGNSASLASSLIFLFLTGLVLNGFAGAALGLVYGWVARKRASRGSQAVDPRPWQDIVMMAAGGILFLALMSGTQSVTEFISIFKGTTTVSLGSETVGVHWGSPQVIAPTTGAPEAGAPGLAAGPGVVAAAWIQASSGSDQVAYAFQDDQAGSPAAWSAPAPVSDSGEGSAAHPQLAVDAGNVAHLVWSQGGSVRYSRCQGEVCSEPMTLATPGNSACSLPAGTSFDHPVVAVSGAGTRMIVWDAGNGVVGYNIWVAADESGKGTNGCFQAAPPPMPSLDIRLASAGGEKSAFALIYGPANETGDIRLARFAEGHMGEPVVVGMGSDPAVMADRNGKLHGAWCGSEGNTSYLSESGAVEPLAEPPCSTGPALAQDAEGLIHLVWYTDRLRDNFDTERPANVMVESLRTGTGWTEPALITAVRQPTRPAAAMQAAGAMHLAWSNAATAESELRYARQDAYQCSLAELSRIERVVMDVIQSRKWHPADYKAPFCGNQTEGLVFMPNPHPAFSSAEPTEFGGYTRTGEFLKSAHYEVLLSNMEWDADVGELSPGFALTESIADLYRQVKANPDQYPRGMTVRIVLGNYPNVASLQWGDQIWNVVSDLRDAGVETMEDPSIGWKVEVANYKGQYPHSHTKFVVVDGARLLTAGYNIAWLHLPVDHPSGRGEGLTDLGILISGPIAQSGLTTFDDIWTGARQLICSDFSPEQPGDWRDTCEWKTAVVSHSPDVTKYYLPEGSDFAVALYRTATYKEADEVYVSALKSAEETIDVVHVNFSAELICLVNLLAPNVCTYANALPWMPAIVSAVEENGARVRVIVESANMNGLENRVAIKLLQDELARRGLSDKVEIRFFDGRLHAKSALIDGEFLIVGSQNFHYSSFGPAGLLEFSAATDAPQTIETYQKMFDYFWERAIPPEQASWWTAARPGAILAGSA